MTFQASLQARDLANASARIAALVDGRSTVPILSNALLKVDDGRLTLASTNCDQSLIISVPAAGKGEITLSAARLAAAAAKLDPDQPVELALTRSQVTIAQGRAAWKLPTLSAGDYPQTLIDPVDGVEWLVESAPLALRLNQVSGAAAVDKPGHSYLEGVYFDLGGEVPALVACDINRLALAEIADLAPPKAGNFILPLPAIRPIADLARSAARLTVRIGNGVVSFEGATEHTSERIRTRLIEGQYPDYARIIPKSRAHRIAVDAATLGRVVGRAAVVEGDPIQSGRSKKRITALRVDLGDEVLAISSRNSSGEEAADACEFQRLDGGSVTVGINANYLLWAADSFGEVDTLEIGIEDASGPILLTRASDTAPEKAGAACALRLVMPMRI